MAVHIQLFLILAILSPFPTFFMQARLITLVCSDRRYSPLPPPPREYHRNLPEGFVYRSVGVWNRLHTCSLDYYIYIYLQAILDNKLDICCACIYLLSKITWNPRTYLILINRYILCSVHAAFFPGHPHPIIISLSTLQGHKYVWYQHLSERVDPPAVEII